MEKSSERRRQLAYLAWLSTGALLAYGLFEGAIATGYYWDWSQIPSFFYDFAKGEPGLLTKGLLVTLQIISWSLGLTLLVGSITACMRLFGGPVLAAVALLYLEIIRNTPLLVQLTVVYFILGPIFDLSAFWATVITLSLFEGAYLSEIIRSSILAVEAGQWQAAYCLGLSTPTTLGRVILPQTAPMLIPPLCSLIVSLIKDSALASTIAVYELTKAARSLVAETFLAFELWLSIAFVYLIINLFMSYLGAMLETRLAVSRV